MKLANELLHQITDPDVSGDERAQLRCRLAKQLEESGNFENAREAIGDIWLGIGHRPVLDGLSEIAAAEVLLRAGALTGWLGSIRPIEGAQSTAKDLISESINILEKLQVPDKLAEAQTDLAYCYWREGAVDEARVILKQALSLLGNRESDCRAVTMLRLAIVEWSSKRFHDSFRVLVEAAPLFEKSTNDVLKGKFHHGFGFVLRNLFDSDNRSDYLDRALIEYAAASFYFQEAGLSRYQGCVENNLGFLFCVIGKFVDAHQHLDCAQMLFTRLKDSVHLAQVDETRARVLLAEGRLVEAEKTVRASVRTLEQGDEQSLLAEALRTHGIAQARLKHPHQAKATLQRALDVAERAGDLESAGNAALVIVEELIDHVPNDELKLTVDRASELLAKTQDLSALKRLANCSNRVLAKVHASPRFPGKVDWTNFSFRGTLLEYEAHLINLALEDAGGVVSKAARLLGFNHHQSLLSMLNGRHEVLRHRSTPILPRRRSIIRSDENGSQPGKRRRKRTLRILLIEDDASVSSLIQDNIDTLGAEVEEIADGTAGMELLASGVHFDLLVLKNEIPGVSGKNLARLARSLSQYRKTPIVVLSANADDQIQSDDSNLFWLSSDEPNRITETINQIFH